MLKTLLYTSVIAFTLSNTAEAFQANGSSRVPFKVQRDQNLRDPQYAQVPIVHIENVYGSPVQMNSGYYTIKCGNEQVNVNPTDHRNWFTRFVHPKQNYVYEHQYNCRKVYEVQQDYSPSYWVYYEIYGQMYKIQMADRPVGRYITVRVN